MGKPKKSLFQQPSKKNRKKPQISKLNSDEDEQVDDVMAWGRKRQNYYRQDEDEYSSLSEQQKEAEQIYNNKYDNYLNDEDVYDIPEQKQVQPQHDNTFKAQIDENFEEQQALPEQYIRQQLEWVLQLFKDLQFYEENSLLRIYQKLLKSYLTVIVSIKELKIPYIQYHPIIPIAVDIKTKINQLMKKLTLKDEQEDQKLITNTHQDQQQSLDEENQDQEQSIHFQQEADIQDPQDQISRSQQFDQNDWDQPKSKNIKSNLKPYPDHCTQASKIQSSEHKKGLQFYNSMKAAHDEEKKHKKQQKRQERKQKKKPAFKQLGQNQGRFASELILKNKGLMKKRKKIEGNSRVKLRKKYQKKKAIHRARSGHFVRQNPGRGYQGQSNIRTGKIAGVRLK